MAFSPEHVSAARRHLRRRDPVMRELLDRVGPFRLKVRRDRFGMLVGSIIAQQISWKAARSIRARLEALVAPERITPHNLAALPIEKLRSAGVSPQKASYLHDLAAKVDSEIVRLDRVGRLTDDDVIAELVQVKGIGVWTAQMFLMFSLGRLDVFPHDDLGIRAALRQLYRLKGLPDRKTGERIAQAWRPYATVGSWYCWRSLELAD